MASPTPDQDVASFIAGSSGAPSFTPVYNPSTSGSNVFASLVLPASQDGNEGGVPANAIFIVSTAGPAPDPYFGAGNGSFYSYNVQVRTRSTNTDYAGGLALARWVRDTLHRATIPCAATAGDYVGCLALESDAMPLGADGQGNFEFSANFRLWLATTP